MQEKVGGLAGVVVADSAICLCQPIEESLLYRGYSIEDLTNFATFEEVAWLLLRGSLPTKKELDSYKLHLTELREIPDNLKRILESIPASASMMDVLRTGCSALGTLEIETQSTLPFRIADRLLASFPSMLFYWYYFHRHKEFIDLNTRESTVSGHILHLLCGQKPSELMRRCLDVSLILYAEHEFNASTFTVRTIASTLSDFYSAVCGGIGALKGSLHGGANEWALNLIEKISKNEEIEKQILEMLSMKQLIMGFGHRVYTKSDPRSAIIKNWAKKLGQTHKDSHLFSIAERIENVMWQEKKLFPNLDFYSALAYHFCNIPKEMFTPLFVFSRIAGWSAHLIEQRTHNKLIRPNSAYIGPSKREWVSLNER